MAAPKQREIMRRQHQRPGAPSRRSIAISPALTSDQPTPAAIIDRLTETTVPPAKKRHADGKRRAAQQREPSRQLRTGEANDRNRRVHGDKMPGDGAATAADAARTRPMSAPPPP